MNIFSDRDLNSIDNPWICRSKEKTFSYSFTIQHNPGKWNRGADAFSRNPSNNGRIHNIISIYSEEYEEEPSIDEDMVNSINHVNVNQFLTLENKSTSTVTIKNIQNACQYDSKYQSLLITVKNGLPSSKMQTNPDIRSFWEVN